MSNNVIKTRKVNNADKKSDNKLSYMLAQIEQDTDISQNIKDTLIAFLKALKNDKTMTNLQSNINNIGDIIPYLTNTNIDKLTVANSKAINTLGKVIRDLTTKVQPFNIDVASQKEKRDNISLLTKCIIAYGDNVTTTKPFTEYDRNIFNAVISISLTNSTNNTDDDKAGIFTADMVYRAMTNDTDSRYVSNQSITAIEEALDKLSQIQISIDCTDEYKRRYPAIAKQMLKNNDNITYTGYLLPLESVTVKTSNVTKKAYNLISTPVLYKYSSLTKQVYNIPVELLTIHKVDNGVIQPSIICNTVKRINVKSVLLRRIYTIKHGTINNKIKLDSILNTALGDNISRKTRRNYRDYAINCLEYWRAKGLITDFETVYNGKSVDGFIITYNNDIDIETSKTDNKKIT